MNTIAPAGVPRRTSGAFFPVLALRRFVAPVRGTVLLLTWGGLRGGISIALALSLPERPFRNALVVITYVVVVFSVLGQGLTLGSVARRFSGGARAAAPLPHT